MDIMDLNIEELWILYQDRILGIAGNIFVALLIFVVGRWIIKRVVNLFVKLLKSKNIDPTLIPTLRGVVRVGLMASLIFAVVGRLGISTSGFLAIFGAAGLAIGLALQGSLSNFAGGILILTLKPFKAGDVINVNGETGSVHTISIINTVLKTPDNKTIYMPNGSVASANITNYSEEGTRRVDQTYGIGYDDDFEKAKMILNKIISSDSRALKNPEPFVKVGNLGDNSVDLTVRVWVKSEDYWGLHFDFIEKVKKTFDEEGISFPYPQRDVHLFNENSGSV